MKEPSDGEIYAAYSRRFESAEVRNLWLQWLRMVAKEFTHDLPSNAAKPHDTEGEL